MAHRRVQKKDFVGRTIVKIDTSADNVWRFFFKDGGIVAIETEVFGGYNGIPAMFICDECARDAT